MKRRWTAALLALILAAALLPAAAQAAQPGRSAGDHFTGADRAVYQALRAEVEKIAAGERTDTTIRVPDQDSLSWSVEELGLKGSSQNNVLDTLGKKFRESVHMEQIFIALSADCPYEMFWTSNAFSWGYTSTRQDDQISIRDLVIQLQVAQAYRADGSSTTVSAAKVAAAHQAAENAKAIVERYQDLSDYEKLNAYREEICRLTSYDMQTFWNDPPYGDPWQMVYVFDGDPDTKVVCEGYSKAFKYLCDLSDFDGDVTCWLVSGTMDRSDHMWNVVRMGDGQNYLVDVTNCDSGMVGADDKLFLSGAVSSDGGRTYTVSKGDGCYAVYSYDEEMEGLFTDGWLAVSADDYDDSTAVIPPPQHTAPPTPGSAFTDVAEGAYYAEAVAWAVEQGITDGTSGTTFSPSQDCTQAQILTFLWRAAGEPESEGPLSIPGVADAYRGAIIWADSMGMIDQSEFDPSGACTRAAAVAYIWQAFGQPSAEAASFADVASDAPYAQAVDWALDKGVTTGKTDTTFDPDGVCGRGQIVTFLYRAYH